MAREFSRAERVSGQLRRELALLIQRELRDPKIGFVSISDAEVSRDLAIARVYVTVFDAPQASESIAALNHAAAFLRRRLGKLLKMRAIPELRFFHDASVETGQHVDALISRAIASDRHDNGEEE